MVKQAFSAALGGALVLGSFLCLGMGMDMGAGSTPQESHDCCGGGTAPESAAVNCCLLLPGAASAPVALPHPSLSWVAVPATAAARTDLRTRGPVLSQGPPGAVSPGHAAPASPRAPPVA
ncbi:MAG: hypothetical protein HYZ75_12325 [Elusimicrobia bacterium]|nr:hypothetical protein [Elusimicrobiota bacterium]